MFCPHSLFHVFCKSQNGDYFAVKYYVIVCCVWNVLCLLHTAEWILAIYMALEMSLCNIYCQGGCVTLYVWPNEIGRDGDAASQVAVLTDNKQIVSNTLLTFCVQVLLLVCVVLPYVVFVRHTMTSPPLHNECLRSRLFSRFIFLI